MSLVVLMEDGLDRMLSVVIKQLLFIMRILAEIAFRQSPETVLLMLCPDLKMNSSANVK